jgi:hypothetical protein
MKYDTYEQYIAKIFAAHSKAVPSGEIAKALWERIQGLPDAYLPWAAAKLADYEKLPGNLGRELAGDLYSAWLSEHRNRAYEPRGCSNCDGGTPGWYFGYRDDDPVPVLLKCPCNADRKFADVPAVSPRELRERGMITRHEYLQRQQALRDSGALPTRFKRSDAAGAVAALQEPPRPAHERERSRYSAFTGVTDAYFTGPLYELDDVPF